MGDVSARWPLLLWLDSRFMRLEGLPPSDASRRSRAEWGRRWGVPAEAPVRLMTGGLSESLSVAVLTALPGLSFL